MPKDYKNINHNKTTSPVRSQGLLPFITGLVMGLFVAFIVYLHEHQNVMEISEQPELVIENTGNTETISNQKVKNIPEPKFDFYQILPNMEVNVSEWEASEQDKAEDLVDKTSVYILQVGSFQQYEAADEVKAELALLGINADIQRVVINGRDVLHRVRVGPYKDLDKLQEARERLLANNLEFMVLKLKIDDIGIE
ncbi:MAG: SPOR domain-containing protein [Gammaproteobacteria bacterium]|nr:SPOR domain-containing protein [Gammaproteobacteria bacterium]